MKTEKNMEEAILEAATVLFLEKGFATTSTTEIAKKAGCNQALVHYYFRTKERLFEAIFKNKFKVFLESLLVSFEEDMSFEDRLARKISSHFDLIARNPQLPGLIINELSRNPERLALFRNSLSDVPQRVLASLDKELQEEIAKGNVRPMSVYDLLLNMISLNVMPFILSEPFKSIAQIPDDKFAELLEHRKEENIQIILKGIKP